MAAPKSNTSATADTAKNSGADTGKGTAGDDFGANVGKGNNFGTTCVVGFGDGAAAPSSLCWHEVQTGRHVIEQCTSPPKFTMLSESVPFT